jgi:hypothetical protein
LNSQFVFEQCDLIFHLLYEVLHFYAFYIIGCANRTVGGDRGG